MELLTWKQEQLATRRYTVSAANGPIGKLEFDGWTSNNANFSTERINLAFERKGWLEHEVTISFKGEVVGISKTSGFGKTTTTLVTGEVFTLEGKLLDSRRRLLDATGNTLLQFEQHDISGNTGSITTTREIPELTKLLLVAIGLYFRNLGQ
jgi:hypothetical protein